MNIYHFIKYNENTSFENLVTKSDNRTTLCFDFEDSIQDCLYPGNTPSLKTLYRQHFRAIADTCKTDYNKVKVGVRVNSIGSHEYLLDLVSLKGAEHISAIFLPKINNAGQIVSLQTDLQKYKIKYDEIVPIIETKAGLDNLSEILRKNNSTKIKNIAFGHCDYNFDNQNYPFFHQDSREYWSWITRLFEKIKSYNLSLVNSPLLQLDNDEYFLNMLSILYSICGNKCGQITLTKKQTDLCNSFLRIEPNTILPKIDNRLDLSVPEFYAEKFIESFKKNYFNKGFAISENKILLSPQEYLASLKYKGKANLPDVNFTFVGGCFPVQRNLPFENLFHQLLKRKIEQAREVCFNVNIIRYERFKNCLIKISTYEKKKKIDILTFSIRPEPVLRLVKLYYKFLDSSSGKRKWALNLPIFNSINPEKHDLLSLATRFNAASIKDSSKIRKVLINLNYLLGFIVCNYNYSLRSYLSLISEVIQFSAAKNIQLIIIGPPIRTNTIIERFICRKLKRDIQNSLANSRINYVSGSDFTNNEKYLFDETGIYATETYHEIISERLLERILPLIEEITAPDTGFALVGDNGNRNI